MQQSILVLAGMIAQLATPTKADQSEATSILNLNEKGMTEDLETNGLTLERGKPLTLSVIGNPTTGYTWNVDQAKTNGLFTVEEQYKTSANARARDGMPIVGAGGTYYFTLEQVADGTGEGCFSITNSRVWSGETVGHIEIPVYVQ